MMAALQRKMFGHTVDPVRIGRYEVLDRLGEGAMGVVYRARDRGLGREVALKLIATRFTERAGATARLRREARALARLEHPNVVKVLDIGEHEDQVFVAMEKVDGGPLLDWARAHEPGTRGRIALLRDLFDQAAAALSAAHRAGVIHRDVKPQNMLLGTDGRLRLADFGLASSIRDELTEPGYVSSETESVLAPSGVVGTPAYMAPEQFEGIADERADQFALCASFWEVAYGTRAFTGSTIVALREAIATQVPNTPADVRDVPSTLRRVLLRGLEEDPRERYPSIDALRDDLRRRPGRRGAVIVGGVGVGVAAVLAATGNDASRCAKPPSEVRSAWNRDVQKRVHDRFVSAAPEDGASALARVDADLQAYADAWQTTWSEACKAGWREGTQAALDAQMLCLARAEQAYVAVVDVLAEQDLDDVVVQRAVTVAEKLPPLDACQERDQAASLPPDPDTRAEVERLWGELDALMLFKFATNAADELVEAQEILAAAERIGYAPLVVDAGLAVGEYQITLRDPAAIETLERTFTLATQAGLHAMAARCALMQSDADQAFGRGDGKRFEAHARAWAERIENPVQRETTLMRFSFSQADRLVEDGQYEEALQVLDAAARHFEARSDADAAFLLMGAYEERGRILVKLGRYTEATPELERALAQRERLPDATPHHEVQIRALLAQVAHEMGKREEAAEQFAALLPFVERSFGTRHPAYAATVGNLAQAQVLAGKREDGVSAMRQTLVLFDEINPPNHPSNILARSNLARVLDPGPEKVALHLEACELALEHHGVDSELYATTRSMRATDLMTAGEYEEALALARESLAVFERIGKERKIIDDLTTVARSLTGMGRAKEALPFAERAVAQARATYGEGGAGTTGPELALALALHAAKRDDEAREALTRAETASSGTPHTEYRADLDALRAALGDG